MDLVARLPELRGAAGQLAKLNSPSCNKTQYRINHCYMKSKVMRCSRYGNGDRMHVILNGEPLEEVHCFKYLGSQVAADGGFLKGCGTKNE